MLYRFFHFSIHPFVPLKFSTPSCSAICLAFSINWGPPGCIFLEQARVYHECAYVGKLPGMRSLASTKRSIRLELTHECFLVFQNFSDLCFSPLKLLCELSHANLRSSFSFLNDLYFLLQGKTNPLMRRGHGRRLARVVT